MRAAPDVVREEPPPPKPRHLFGRVPPPTAQELLRELRRTTNLRLKLEDGEPYVSATEGDAVLVLKVGSKEFFEFVDSWRLGRHEKLVPPKTLAELNELITEIVRAPEKNKEPLWAGRRPLLEAELSGLSGEVPNPPDRPGPPPPTEPRVPGTERTETLDLDSLRVRVRPEYVPRRLHGSLDTALLQAAARAKLNVLLEGPPGSGKSMACRAVAFDLGLPLVRLDLHDSIDTEDLLGAYRRIDGEWVWRDGSLTTLVKNGGVFVAEEINAGRHELWTRLHTLLDSRTLLLPEHRGEQIVAHDSFFFVGTENDRGDGSKPLTARLRDRFDLILAYPYDEEVEAKLCPDPALRRAFALLRSDARIRTPVSTRVLVSLLRNNRTFGPAVALRLFVGRFSEAERRIVAETLVSVRQDSLLERSDPLGRIIARLNSEETTQEVDYNKASPAR